MAVTLVILVASGFAAAAPPTSASCEGKAPKDLACRAGPFRIPADPKFTFAVLGFVGKIRLDVVDATGKISLTCWSVADPEVAGGCDDVQGHVTPGSWVRLRCRAMPTSAGVGPAGPWGCRVDP